MAGWMDGWMDGWMNGRIQNCKIGRERYMYRIYASRFTKQK